MLSRKPKKQKINNSSKKKVETKVRKSKRKSSSDELLTQKEIEEIYRMNAFTTTWARGKSFGWSDNKITEMMEWLGYKYDDIIKMRSVMDNTKSS